LGKKHQFIRIYNGFSMKSVSGMIYNTDIRVFATKAAQRNAKDTKTDREQAQLQ